MQLRFRVLSPRPLSQVSLHFTVTTALHVWFTLINEMKGSDEDFSGVKTPPRHEKIGAVFREIKCKLSGILSWTCRSYGRHDVGGPYIRGAAGARGIDVDTV